MVKNGQSSVASPTRESGSRLKIRFGGSGRKVRPGATRTEKQSRSGVKSRVKAKKPSEA